MNRAFIIIGVPAVGVATFYTAIFWGRWVATVVAILSTLALVVIAKIESRRRQAAQPPASGQDHTPIAR